MAKPDVCISQKLAAGDESRDDHPAAFRESESGFSGIRDMPHQDTLCRLLEKIDADQIENRYISNIQTLAKW